jgi:hypothetical protein
MVRPFDRADITRRLPMTMNTTILSRRRALAALAAAAPAAAVNGLAVAMAASSAPDPIFAVIVAHSEATKHEIVCHKTSSAMEKSLPDDRQTWHLYVGHNETPPDGCADAPEWIASQLAILGAYNRRDEAVEALLTTAPTTFAGALDFLDYLAAPEFPGSHESLMNSICQRYDDVNFLTNLAATMRRLIGDKPSTTAHRTP